MSTSGFGLCFRPAVGTDWGFLRRKSRVTAIGKSRYNGAYWAERSDLVCLKYVDYIIRCVATDAKSVIEDVGRYHHHWSKLLRAARVVDTGNLLAYQEAMGFESWKANLPVRLDGGRYFEKT